MKFFLIVSKGKHRGMPIPITIDLFLVGQAKECQLRANHSNIGDQHAAIAIRGKKAFIRDLGSGKETFVNGSQLPTSEEWPLHKNDTIAIGPLEFRVSFSEKLLSQRDLEEWALRTLDEDTGPKKSAIQELEEIDGRASAHHDDAADAAGAIMAKLSAIKGVVRGRLRINRENNVTIVKLGDAYLVDDAELVHVKKELHDNLDVQNLRVLLDLKNVRRMSAAAVSMFAELSSWLKSRGSTMALCRLRPELGHLVEDLRSVFNLKVFDDKAKAVANKW